MTKYDELRKKVWGAGSVKLPRIRTNPEAKALLQDKRGQFTAKVVESEKAYDRKDEQAKTRKEVNDYRTNDKTPDTES